ncbi:hypothetical protein BT69DRAFT_638788 [Atractiella rhizophila]|nr:hypothetical protein BT69DRAFT_638788 [Atractiella rhizophila]
MWLLTGMFVQPNGKEIEQTKLLIPGRSYCIGRGHMNDFSIGGRANKRQWMKLSVKQADKNGAVPLEVGVFPKATAHLHRDGSSTTIGDATKPVLQNLQDGDVVSTRASGPHTRTFTFRWQPFCLFGTKKIKKELQEVVKRVGGSIVSSSSPPIDSNVTHAILPTFKLDFRAIQLSLQGAWLISQSWLDALAPAAKYNPITLSPEPPKLPTHLTEEAANEFQKWYSNYYEEHGFNYPTDPNVRRQGFCSLELDFEKNWAKEEECFPNAAISENDEEPKFYDSKFWKPDANRAEVFAGCFFVGVGDDAFT